MHSLVIHGGAGVVLARISSGRFAEYEASLGRILDSGFDVLESGGSGLDAVTLAVRMLEDDPLFNAGRGAALTSEGTAELDAAIMDGCEERAGAVAAVQHVKNPVELARRVLENSPHVMLVGAGAEEFALQQGMIPVPNRYFRTSERIAQLEGEQRGERGGDVAAGSQGTVGAVALDAMGNLAAATSTGGVTNKHPGRVGDSPLIGAGTYAKNGVCAVSGTGQGEYFIRAVAAHHIAAAVEYRRMALEEAVQELVHRVLPRLGGLGGIIAVDAHGKVSMDFNTQGMFRGARDSNGRRTVAIAR
jgi:L-asparaginase / beta-aspartyl-peptidase